MTQSRNWSRHYYEDPGLLDVAAAGGDIDIIKMLLNAQANIFAKDGYWEMPLRLAVRYERMEALKYLMQFVAELQAKAKAENGEAAANEEEEDDIPIDEIESLKSTSDVTYLDEAIMNNQR